MVPQSITQSDKVMKKNRIQSIDILRGIVMIIMALDHIRYYFHADSFYFSASDISQTTPILFFTRFITHFCAPVFLFLSGCSAFLVGKRKTKKELAIWLIKRGLWLILIAFTLEELGWSFKIDFTSYDLGVLWSLGASMIILAAVQFSPGKVAVVSAIIIIVLQHLFDGYRPESANIISNIWRILHVPGGFEIVSLKIGVAFPLLPWAATMILGFYFGELYTISSVRERKTKLIRLGVIAITIFFILRMLNTFGDQNPWVLQENSIFTLLSFFNISKAPASLCFISLTIGCSMLFLAFIEGVNNRFTDFCIIFGRTPFFFYLLHIYLIHCGAAVLGYFQGFDLAVLNGWISFQKHLQGYGVNLFVVYLLWITLTMSTYPACKRFYLYKVANNNFVAKYF